MVSTNSSKWLLALSSLKRVGRKVSR